MATGGKIGRQTVEGVIRIEGILLQHHFWCSALCVALRVGTRSATQRDCMGRALLRVATRIVASWWDGVRRVLGVRA